MQNIPNGFRPPADTAPGSKRGTAAIAALMMIVALTLGTLAAATAVTIGIVRGNGEAARSLASATDLSAPLSGHRG